uniref:Uncharacterized protein n=1 Tax=Arundo donax TaxID=35708 RepID=A0A0A9ALA1_ARUDO
MINLLDLSCSQVAKTYHFSSRRITWDIRKRFCFYTDQFYNKRLCEFGLLIYYRGGLLD